MMPLVSNWPAALGSGTSIPDRRIHLASSSLTWSWEDPLAEVAPVVGCVVPVAVVVTGADVEAPAADVELVEEEPLEELPHAASPKHASDINSAAGVCMRPLKPV